MAQVYWLLLAISQDNPKNKHAAEMRDRCERAALEGFWVRACARAPPLRPCAGALLRSSGAADPAGARGWR